MRVKRPILAVGLLVLLLIGGLALAGWAAPGVPAASLPASAAPPHDLLGPSPTPGCTPVVGGWSAGANYPTTLTRGLGVYFPPTGKFYVLGGRTGDTAGTDLLNPREYNPTTNSWTTKSAAFDDNQVNNMVGGLLTVGGTPYIVTVGGSAAGSNFTIGKVRLYNPISDSFILLASDPWPPGESGVLPGGAAVVNNQVIILGGFQVGTGMTTAIWRFDPAQPGGGRWAPKAATLPLPRGFLPTEVLGSYIYTAGGTSYVSSNLVDTTDTFRYDPTADVICDGCIPSLNTPTGETQMVVHAGMLWVLGGGRTPPNPTNQVQAYDPGTNGWHEEFPFFEPRRNIAADTNGTNIWLVGGYAQTTATNSMERYTPPVICATATPSVTPPATATRTMTATVPPGTTPSATATLSPGTTPSATATLPPGVTPSATPCSLMFSDVPANSPFYPFVRCLVCRGIISGYANGTFGLFNSLTRGQATKMIANAAAIYDSIPSAQQTFSDTPPSNPFWVFIERLAGRGYISGYGDGTFRPYNTITRGQFAKVDANAAQYADPIPSGQQTFADVLPGSPFWIYVERVTAHGVISGYGCDAANIDPCTGQAEVCDGQTRPYFRTCALATRGQAAKIVANTFYPGCQTPAR